jgi:hypothetical protein
MLTINPAYRIGFSIVSAVHLNKAGIKNQETDLAYLLSYKQNYF